MPNRILKESICTSDDIEKLKPFEEIFFYRLIVNCDDYGRFDARIRILKNRLFPLKDSITNKNVEEALARLASIGLVVLYEIEGRPFLFLPTWAQHQQMRAKRSKYPEPDINGYQMISDVPGIQSESESESEYIKDDVNAPAREELQAAQTYLEQALGGLVSPTAFEELRGFLDKGMELGVILAAVDIAVDNGKRSWNYVRSILNDKAINGVKTLADFRRKEQEYREIKKKAGHAAPTPRQSRLAIEGHKRDFEEIERLEREALQRSLEKRPET